VVGGTAFADENDQIGQDGTSDFSNTAVMQPLYIADINGNPIPGNEDIRIVGESGIEYAMTAVPEPAAGVVFAMAMIHLWRRRNLN
jgi:hypothetical protein